MNNILITALIGGAAVIVGTALYFSKRRKSLQPKIKQVEVDKLTLTYVANYFKINPHIIKDGIVPIALKIKEGNVLNIPLESTDEFQYVVVLTYYDEKANHILSQNTLLIKAKELDINLKDSFSDKDMLVLT